MKKSLINRLYDDIIYYNLIWYFLFLIIILLIRTPFHNMLCNITDVDERSIFYNLYWIATDLFLLGGWTMLLFINCRAKRYLKLTGRDFAKDHAKYKRSYTELVDYFKDADPHRLDLSGFPVKVWQTTHGFVFGMDGKKLIYIPSNSESNIAVFGPPGSGKTAGFAIINAICFEGSVIAIDVKGDIYNYVHKHTKRKIIRFCPDDPDALSKSCHFNPFRDLKKMSVTDRKLYIESMAIILIPDEGGSDGSYFTTRARKYFQGITHMLLHENPNISFPEVIHRILDGNAFDWVTDAIKGDCQEAKELLASFYGNNEKNVSGAYDNLCTALIPFSNPVLDELLSNKGKSISIKALESGYDIYLQIAQEHLDVYAPLFTLLIQSFSTAFTKRKDSSTGVKNRPILMLLDEFPALSFSYKMINSNLSTLRSKSIVTCMIQQNYAQLEYRYQPTGARSLIGNCNYQIILGSNETGSSEAFSRMFGKKKILKITNSENHSKDTSTGYSVSESEELIFHPEDFGDLPSENAMIIYFKGKYAKIQKLNCYKDLKKQA